MANIKKIKRKNGVAFQVSFYHHGARRYLSLGSRYDKSDAEEVARIIERILDAEKVGRDLDPKTATWLRYAPKELLDKLDALDLIRQTDDLTLGALVDLYRRDEFPRLSIKSQQIKEFSFRWFFRFFDSETLVSEVTRLDANRFSNFLESSTLAAASVTRVLKDARRLFTYGVELDLFDKNPLSRLRIGSSKNKEREFYVERELFERVLSESSPEFRVLLSLLRIGGLRYSETLLVKWGDVDFQKERFVVYSPKTERTGKDKRIVPLFPELESELRSLRRGKKDELVVNIARTSALYILRKILKKLNIEPWPRLFQNLRSSRAIEISREFGFVAESAWIGHSPKVARDHYLHIIEADFEKAIEKTTPKTTPIKVKKGAKKTKKEEKTR